MSYLCYHKYLTDSFLFVSYVYIVSLPWEFFPGFFFYVKFVLLGVNCYICNYNSKYFTGRFVIFVV